MSGKNKQNESVEAKSGSTDFAIREIKDGEMERAAELISRLKRLNGEFDPLLKTSEKVDSDSLRTLRETVADKNAIVLVALSNSKLVGVVKAVLRDRIFYEPRREGAIVEFYILPEFRRGRLGRDLFDGAVSRLEKRGAVLITAEFPSQNEIAKKFYTKLGFRSLTNVYARSY
ncbi:MAG: GNAT family N-acetyltransferase [Nitrososphaerales archaeon]